MIAAINMLGPGVASAATSANSQTAFVAVVPGEHDADFEKVPHPIKVGKTSSSTAIRTGTPDAS